MPDRADPASGVPPACTDLSCPCRACSQATSQSRAPGSWTGPERAATQHGRGAPHPPGVGPACGVGPVLGPRLIEKSGVQAAINARKRIGVGLGDLLSRRSPPRRIHWPRTSGRSPLATACVLWLRFPPAGSGRDDSTSSGNELCVDSGLASFGAFSGARRLSCVGSLRSGSPSPQPPEATCRSPLPPDSLATDHWPLTTVSGSPSPPVIPGHLSVTHPGSPILTVRS